MDEYRVVIHIPRSAFDGDGFADGGGPWPIDLIMWLGSTVGRCLEWLFNPITTYRHREATLKSRKEEEEKNLREGKNRDGSYTESFPTSTTLEVALRSLGLNVDGAKQLRESTLQRLGSLPLGLLSPEEIARAVLECQVAEDTQFLCTH